MGKVTSLNEFDKLFDSVYPQQINLKSFDKKKELCPEIWKDNDLKKIIKKHLKSIAENFIDDLEMPDFKIKDIMFVGSMAGYNWSKYADIDLHILTDFSSLKKHGDKETLKKLFDLKKNDWNAKHHILIYGYPIEIYIQDTEESNASDGVYSIKYGKWVKIPHFSNEHIDRELVKKQASQYINIIDRIEELSNKSISKKQCAHLKDEIEKLHDEIVSGRRSGIASEGEYSAQNIIFKVLRRSGHLEKIRDIKTKLFDKIQSL